MPQGKIKWYNRVKGYGFIVPSEGEGDIFFHHSVLKGKVKTKLKENFIVLYEAQSGQKGLVATAVSDPQEGKAAAATPAQPGSESENPPKET